MSQPTATLTSQDASVAVTLTSQDASVVAQENVAQQMQKVPENQQAELIRLCEEWNTQYPNIVKMAAMPSIANEMMPKLVKGCYFYPVMASLELNENVTREKSAISSMVHRAFAPKMHEAPWTNPELNEKLLNHAADCINKSIEKGIEAAESGRSIWAQLFRSDVMKHIHISSSFHHKVQHHETFAISEGHAQLVRQKGFIVGTSDTVVLQMNITFKVITVDAPKMENVNTSKKLLERLADYDPLDDL